MREAFMRRAISLAERGRGYTTPNPLVGAVLVRDGEVIDEGSHAFYDDPYVEHAALEDCFQHGLSPTGTSLYVTLEPCCHTGKQPPCTEAILATGVRAVFIGGNDPSPLVVGKGIAALQQGGIAITEHVSESACDALNAPFFHHIRIGLPFIPLRYAMTLDGKTAYASGTSRWITGKTARREVHRTHAAVGTVMASISAVPQDDPLLTYRIPGRRNPLRVVYDSDLRVPLGSALVKTATEVPALLACCVSGTARHEAYLVADCEVLTFPGRHVDLRALLTSLGTRGINEVLVERDAGLGWTLFSAGLAQRVQAYIAPKLFGRKSAPSALGGTGVPYPIDAFALKNIHIRFFGTGVRIEEDL